MKKILCAVLPALITLIVYGQAPGLFNYQGVARNSVGNVLQNKNISLRLSIHDGTENGPIVYSETRSVLTNPLGLFNIQVGSTGAAAVTGTIATVNWSTGKKYIQVEIDPDGGSSFIHIGVSQLASVPYALNAAGAAPTGPAGGSLTGTYPNPTITNAAITQVMIAPGVSLPPNGPAGGSLTGTYPNPTIADAAITQVMIAPGVSLPPNGTAGGDLSGTYPNPALARIKGIDISNTIPTAGQVLQFDGTSWAPGNSASNYWTLNGTTIYNNNSGSIGVGTTTPDASAILDISNTGKGILIPRMSTIERNAIAAPATGLLIFDNDANSFWFYNGVDWVELATGSNGWNKTGNAGTDPALHFIGTTDAVPLKFRINNINAGVIDSVSNSTGIGFRALDSMTTGHWNTAVGYKALMLTTTGEFNTAIGGNSLRYNSTGYQNSAIGFDALFLNATGFQNTATGAQTLFFNSTGSQNTATGAYALYHNTTGEGNTAHGISTLGYNTTGYENTANGAAALFSNTTGNRNTANGSYTLFSNTTGFRNVANGFEAMYFNTTGTQNVASGVYALKENTSGHYNVATGVAALMSNTTGLSNTANGTLALHYNTTGSENTAVGYNAGTSSGAFNNTISIGNNGYLNGASNQAFIGNLSTSWIGGNVGWSTFSDARTKVNVQDDVKGLDFINRLKPVTYYRRINAITELTGNKTTEDFPEKYDIEKIKFSGFLAQEVEQAAKDAGYDFNGINRPKKEGDLYSLSYESFVVPLVKAIQEQQQIIEQLKKEIESIKKTIR